MSDYFCLSVEIYFRGFKTWHCRRWEHIFSTRHFTSIILKAALCPSGDECTAIFDISKSREGGKACISKTGKLGESVFADFLFGAGGIWFFRWSTDYLMFFKNERKMRKSIIGWRFCWERGVSAAVSARFVNVIVMCGWLDI